MLNHLALIFVNSVPKYITTMQHLIIWWRMGSVVLSVWILL